MKTIEKLPSYKEGLKELRTNLAAMMPDEVLSLFDNDANRLSDAHQNILKLKKGDKAPSFTLTNAKDEHVSLSSLLKKGKVVLTFYRGNWCPYCNLQLAQYQQALEEIHAKGAQLVAVSPQTPDQSLSMKEKHELQFEVLSDNGNLVAENYTTVFKNADEPTETMAALGIDFDSFYGDDSRTLPIPAVFIIDEQGVVQFAKAEDGDYRARVEVEEILAAL